MKIAVLNQPLGNRGDEAAHRAFILNLLASLENVEIHVLFLNESREKIEEFKVQSDRVNYINIKGFSRAARFSIKQTSIYQNMIFTFLQPLLRKFYCQLKQYDYIMCAPGGICMGGFMNWTHIWELFVAMKLHKKIIYWGRSIGPFTEDDKDHVAFKRTSYRLIKYFKYISLRDEVSFQLAKSIRSDCIQTVDTAFLSQITLDVPESIKGIIGCKRYIVFVPNELTWHYKFRDVNEEVITNFYLKIIEILNDVYPTANIIMLPQTCQSKINDYGYFKELKEKSQFKNKIIVMGDNLGADIQQFIISNSEFVIGARYHSIIFAINNRIPFLSLSYEHKMRGLLESLRLSDRQFDLEGHLLSERVLSDDICNVLRQKMQNRVPIDYECDRAKSIAKNTFDDMIRLLLNKR